MDEVIISIEGNGLSYNGITDAFKAGQVIAFLNAPSGSSAVHSNMGSIATQRQILGVEKPRKSPREAIIQANAKTNAQKIAVLADFWLQLDGKESFSPSDLKPFFAKAGEPVPKNYSRDMRDAVQQCYITELIDQSGQYILTEKGQELVASGFQDEAPTKKSPRKTGGGGASSGRGVKDLSDAIKEIEVVSHMDGFIPFHSLPTKGQKILWILTFAKNNGVDTLSTSEVEYLANRLNENITTSLFNGLNEGNMKKGFVARKGDKYRIIQSGIDLIKGGGSGSVQ